MVRPKVAWTAARRRRLIRLYLATDMHLDEICEVLRDGEFRPKKRKTEDILSETLQSPYLHLRPKRDDDEGTRSKKGRNKSSHAKVASSRIRRSRDMKMRIAGLQRWRPFWTWPKRFSDSENSYSLKPEDVLQDRIQSTVEQSTEIVAKSSQSLTSQSSQPSCSSPHGSTQNERIPNGDITLSVGAIDSANGPLSSPSATPATIKSDTKRPASTDISPFPAKIARTRSPSILDHKSDDQSESIMPRYDRRTLSDLISRASSIASARASLMVRLSCKYSSSYMDDVLSLRSRFSWRSSRASSILTSWHKSLRQNPAKHLVTEPDLANDTDPMLSSHHRTSPPLGSNTQPCWCVAEYCIHRQLRSISETCPKNCSAIPDLGELDIEAFDSFGSRPLHLAAMNGAPFPVFKALIHAGADVNAINAAEETFMHVLDATGLLQERKPCCMLKLSNLLRKNHFDFEARDQNGKSILLSLLEHRDFRMDDRMLEAFVIWLGNEADLWLTSHSRTNWGVSASQYLADLMEEFWNTKRFSKKGKHFLVRAHDWCSGLASISEHVEIGLLSPGEIKTRQAYKGLNALYPALDGRYMLPHGDPNTLHHVGEFTWWPCGERRLEIRTQRLDELLDAGLDINAHDENGHTPMMSVLLSDRPNEIEEETAALIASLIWRGASVHRRDRQGKTVLHMSAERGNSAVVKLLISKGANVNARTTGRESVLTIASNALRQTTNDDDLHKSITDCMRVLIGSGGVAEPSIFQEWATVPGS